MLGVICSPAMAQEDADPVINISGAGEELQGNILTHLQVQRLACDLSLAGLQRQTSRVQEDITRAANALGYYESVSTVEFAAGDPCWQLDIAIVPEAGFYWIK